MRIYRDFSRNKKGNAFSYKMNTGDNEVTIHKQALANVLSISIGTLQYSRKLVKQHSTPSSDSRGIYNIPNKVPDERK
jgi:hypothetical protein